MTAADLRAEATRLLDKAITILKKDGHLVPVAFLFGSGGGVEAVAMPWRDDEQKRAMLEKVYASLQLPGVVGVVTITEAWALTVPKEAFDLSRMVAPSQSPDRRECIALTIVTRSGQDGCLVPFERVGGVIVHEAPRWSPNPTISALPPTFESHN